MMEGTNYGQFRYALKNRTIEGRELCLITLQLADLLKISQLAASFCVERGERIVQ